MGNVLERSGGARFKEEENVREHKGKIDEKNKDI